MIAGLLPMTLNAPAFLLLIISHIVLREKTILMLFIPTKIGSARAGTKRSGEKK